MQRLLLVSNRLPVTIEKQKGAMHFHQSVGGLATGLGSFYKNYDSMWIGWCGLPSNNLDQQTRRNIESELLSRHHSYPIFLSKYDIKMFYSSFCNKTLWPLFHYFTDYTIFDHESWKAYQNINRLFLHDILRIARPDDIIWIHDYHLMLLPQMIRERLPHTQIGFFLHIPFPSFEIFRLLPWRKEIVEGLLGADLIGFHTYDYVRHFFSSARRLLGYDNTFGQIMVSHRIVKADAFPMGIDYERFANGVSDPNWLNEINRRCSDCKIILSVDRLDYTKGISERLEAFDYFLEKYPEYQGQVTLIMIATPSRMGVEQYQHLKQRVDELVGRINGKYGTIDWTPVTYLYRSLSFKKIVTLYNIADVAMVTPLRDGMNLIAKEYLAARKDNKGVLVLSEMAGAKSELIEAIIVNPHNKEEVARSLKEALVMPVEEQIERNTMMKDRLNRYNITTWANDFMGSLARVRNQQEEIGIKILTKNKRKNLLKKYQESHARLIFLDYDGTLVPFVDKPELAEPDEEISDLLKILNKDPRNEVILVSGRDRHTLDNWFGQLKVSLSAEHGVWLKEKGSLWHLIEPIKSEWKGEIRPILETYVDKTPGARIEEKSYSLVWHYRRVHPELGTIRAIELKEDLLHLTANLNLVVLEGSKVIEIKNGGINKGRAALHWIPKKEWDFILAIGDDWTDEDLFEALPESAYSIKVGLTMSKSRFCLTNHLEVRELLQQFGRIQKPVSK